MDCVTRDHNVFVHGAVSVPGHDAALTRHIISRLPYRKMIVGDTAARTTFDHAHAQE